MTSRLVNSTSDDFYNSSLFRQTVKRRTLMGYPVVRCSGSSNSTDGIFRFGGKNYSAVSNDLRFVESRGFSWKFVWPSSLTRPQGRYFHAIACFRESLYVHGGVLGTLSVSNEMWTFSINDMQWKLVEPLSPISAPALAGHTLSITDDHKLYAVGCLPPSGCTALLHRYDFNGTWIALPTESPLRGIYGHSAVYSSRDQRIYVYGGYQMDVILGYRMSNLFHAFELKGPTLLTFSSSHAHPPPLAPVLSLFHGFMLLVGGNGAKYLFHAYIFQCNTWILLNHSDIMMPKQNQFFEEFWTNGSSIFGIATFTSSQCGVLTRLDFEGDLCNLINLQVSPKTLDCAMYEKCFTNTTPHEELPASKSWASNSEATQMPGNSEECLLSTSFFDCTDGCRWCPKCSKCISSSDDCSAVCSNDKIVHDNNSETSNDCTVLTCVDCLKDGACGWQPPRCTTQGCSPGNCHPDSNTKGICPSPCFNRSSCSACLDTESTCLWSLTTSKCYSAYDVGLLCSFGECGAIISWNDKHLCPGRCGNETMCSSCLKKPHCGWCSFAADISPDLRGRGICSEGGLDRPYQNVCHVDHFLSNSQRDLSVNSEGMMSVKWSFISCPAENECENDHHNCDNSSQLCIDRTDGFECQCKEGFNFDSEAWKCRPHCNQGCLHGTCTSPNMCECLFGYVGSNCSLECKCNKHSNCESEQNRSKCLSCHNNTKGESCEKCRPLFVGNPQNGGKCESCLKYCNEQSRICLSEGEFNHTLDFPDLPTTEEHISQWLKYGSIDSRNTKCLYCANHTHGDRCEKCKPGHFRQPFSTTPTACQKCLCNGHSDYCDPEKGDGCDCKNNTKSPRCESSNPPRPCFEVQCSQCVENFLGTPTDDHHCYRQMSVENQQCFDPETQMNCNPTREPDPLRQNRTVFFAIQPKYLNVNIRIFIDVTKGGLNLYFAPFDDAFQVLVSQQDGVHRVLVDPTYKLYDPSNNITINGDEGHRYHGDGGDDVDDAKERDSDANENDRDDVDLARPTSTDRKFKRTPPSNRVKTFRTGFNKEKPLSTTPQTLKNDKVFSQDKQGGASKLYHMEKVKAEGLTTFVTVDKPETFLFVESIVNRLVVILPNNVHPLKVARFYLVLLGVQPESYGSIYMRQDQPHIDLFVFFSVFFSCFFLFLAVCVLLWKAKQMNDARRSRHRSLLEMEHMASRPSAHVVVVVDNGGDYFGREFRLSPSQQQLAVKTLVGSNFDGLHSAVYVDKLANAVSRTNNASASRFLNKKVKNFVIHPISVEYTHDNTVAIATFLFELPGATSARIRSCFGSCLVLPSSSLQTSSKV